MGLTKIAITRPVFILMLMVAAILMGAISYNSMRVEQNPEVNFGVISVTVVYPGSDPVTLSELVARPIEEAVSGVQGLREVTSTSREGVSTVVANFELGTDIDAALNDVRSRVDGVINELPEDAQRPQVNKFDNSAQAILNLGFASPTMSSKELRDELDNKIKDRFAQIPGVASASVVGGDVREISVEVKKDKLLAYGIGINDVQRAVQAASLDVPAGAIKTQTQDQTIRLPAQFRSVDEIRNLYFTVRDPQSQTGASKVVRLGDVATVEDTVAERSSYSRLDGKDAIVLSIQKTREGNAVDITKAATGLIAQLENQYKDQQLKITVISQQAKIISESISDLNFALAFGIFLVALTVYVFLHNFRGMLIVAIAIPLCIFVTFIALKIAGFTINNLSMLALSLAVGVLVDDAIVVLENIYRHLQKGEDPKEAAINGRSEIGLAAISITLVDVVVFLPIATMGGIVGQFFKPLALGFVFAVLSSLFVSFTVTPMLAARWYRRGENVEHPTGGFARAFEAVFGAFTNFYKRVLEWALNHRWFVFISGNLALVAVFMFIGGSFAKAPNAAIIQGASLTFVSLMVGLLIFAANYWPKVIKERTWNWIAFVGSLVGFLAGPKLPSEQMPAPMKPIAGLLLFWALLGVIGLVANIFRTHAKSRLVPSALLFGLIFPLAAWAGFGYAQYKREAVFKFAFMPESDSGSVGISVELPPGASLQETERVVKQIEDIVSKHEYTKYVRSTIGSTSGGFFGAGGNSGSNVAQIQVTLFDRTALMDKVQFWNKHEEKLRPINARSEGVAADMLEAIGRIPGADIKVSAADAQGFGSPIQMAFLGDDRTKVIETANKIKEGLQSGAIAGIINPDTSTNPGKPEIRAIPDRARLADAGLTPADIGASLRTLYQGNDNAKYREEGREYPINVRLAEEDRNDPNVLATVPVAFVRGNPVYLGSVTNTQAAPGVDRIDRRDRLNEVRVTADLLPGYAAGSVQAQIDAWIKDNKMVPEGVVIRPLGQADAQARESIYLFSALALGFILVYMVLASLYDNLLYPAIVQLAQPQAMVGALLALILTDKPLNIVGMIGIICLVGLVGKNAILVVDYANTLRQRGRSRHDALVEAGPVRLRPIMMTTIALVLGTLPVALAIGRGSEFRETIGITIIGGITLSTVLTLVVIPCSYTIFDDLSLWIGRKLGRRPQGPDDDAALTHGTSESEERPTALIQ